MDNIFQLTVTIYIEEQNMHHKVQFLQTTITKNYQQVYSSDSTLKICRYCYSGVFECTIANISENALSQATNRMNLCSVIELCCKTHVHV